ncbi:MAG TPA: sugar phosphate isomerase/epimerase family protein [Clostridia bacterium]|nr:sugar phosphate isomerase/epimerase family protein [Clostridia bacterium]
MKSASVLERPDSNQPVVRLRLAVCTWSLQPANPGELISRLQEAGIDRVQLALDPLRAEPSVWGETAREFQANGISIVSGMFGCVGEDYSTLITIRETGGIAPDATWAENLRNIKATVVIAKTLGLKLVTFHAGFLPHDERDPAFAKLLNRLTEIAGLFEKEGICVGLETGQETADSLVGLLRKLNQPNVGVNFDPANMILYDKGNPIDALGVLGPWIKQVHIKDATRTSVPGTWGLEVAAGTGEVDWTAFFKELNRIGFSGNLVIEREAGNQRVTDIRQAKELVLRTA